MVKCHAQKQRMEGSIYLTYTSMSLLILDKAELLSLNTHSEEGFLIVITAVSMQELAIMFLPSAVLHKPACLVLVLLLTPLESIF